MSKFKKNHKKLNLSSSSFVILSIIIDYLQLENLKNMNLIQIVN